MARATFIFRCKKLRVRLTSASGSELISRTLCCYWPLARRITAWSNSKLADWRFVCPQCLLLLIGFLFGGSSSLTNRTCYVGSTATVSFTFLSLPLLLSFPFSLCLSIFPRPNCLLAKKLGLLRYAKGRVRKKEKGRVKTVAAVKEKRKRKQKEEMGKKRHRGFSRTRPRTTTTFRRSVL